MFKTIVAAAVGALATAVTVVPASADSFRLGITAGAPAIQAYHNGWHGAERRYHDLSPRQVRWILRDEGFRGIRYLDREGRTYVARAVDYRGRNVVVRVSARSGAIVSVRVLHRERPRCWLPEGCG
jgi:hypothetical protein